jgi:predicted RNA-binding protein with PIN domain
MAQRITIIDGYNVIMARLGTADGLEKARERLVRRIAEKNKEPDHSVLVVFDGDDITPDHAHRMNHPNVGVLFSRPPMDADMLIVKLVESRKNDVLVEVVTSDSELAEKAGAFKAKVISAESFWAFLKSADSWPGVSRDSSSSSLKPDYPDEREVDEWEKLFKRSDKEEKN